MKNRKAQVYLLLIAFMLALILYFWLVPVTEKCKVLPDLSFCGKPQTVLLSISPGLLEQQEESMKYAIPSLELFNKEELDLTTLFPGSKATRSWWSAEPKIASFDMHEKSKEVKLFIYASEAKGNLKIYVNNQKVATVNGNVNIVSVPVKFLKTTNTVKLVPSAPFLPWSKSIFVFEKVVLKEVYQRTQQRLIYQIDIQRNLEDVKKATLSFDSECIDGELSVAFDDKEIAKDKICGKFSKEIADFLNKSNNLTFFSQGNYVIRNISLDIEMQKKEWPVYYFSLSSSQFQDLKDGKNSSILELQFAEGTKQFVVNINSEQLADETEKTEWKLGINNHMKEGQNSISIIPKTTFSLSLLKVYIE